MTGPWNCLNLERSFRETEGCEGTQEDYFKFPGVRALQLVPWSIFHTNIWIVLAVQWSKTWRSSWWKAKAQVKLSTDETSDKLPKTEDGISPSTVQKAVQESIIANGLRGTM